VTSNPAWIIPILVLGGLLTFRFVTGRMPARGGGFVRATEPRGFWVTTAIYVVVAIFFAGLGLRSFVGV
jgi:hypothetical protein